MEEKIIIEGKPSKKTSSMLLKIGLFLVVVGLVLFFATARDSWRLSCYDWDEPIAFSDYMIALGDCVSFTNFPVYFVSVILDLGVLFSIYSLFLWLEIKSNCITVTNKRVYGVTRWGKRVDLPLNQISAVSTSSLKGIAVGTSSGKIYFKAIQNHIEVHKEITNLLTEKLDNATTAPAQVGNSPVDEIKKYKELLDAGIITQEEFDAKKKQLLGL